MTRALLPLLLGLLSCGSKLECDEESPCAGFGEVCISGVCVLGVCSTNAQCPMEHVCDPNRQCVPGCSDDRDCYPGSSCDAEGACVEDACEETHVDCGYREFCNQVTGDCFDAGEQYCKPCRVNTQEEDCGAGNLCLAGYCGVDCSGGRECPGGFECYPWGDSAGNIIAYQCFTYCWLYEDYEPGQDGDFSRVTPTARPLPLELPDASCAPAAEAP